MEYNELLMYLAKSQINLDGEFWKISKNANHKLYNLAQNFINEFNINFEDIYWFRDLYRKVAEFRNNELITTSLPYNHKGIGDLTVDKNKLVSLSNFDIEKGSFHRNNYIFGLAPTTASPNSSYWLTETIIKHGISNIKVRLDPFFIYPIKEYYPACYKMLCYGRELNWSRIENLTEDEHCRWMPDRHNSDIEFTDLVWCPRDNEIHLVCEEFPKVSAIEYMGSRYLHAIYSIEKQGFIHIDGALRFYSKNEHEERKIMHVRNIGKIGKRIKIFQADNNITKQFFCDLATTFFVWNEDINSYFMNSGDFAKSK